MISVAAAVAAAVAETAEAERRWAAAEDKRTRSRQFYSSLPWRRTRYSILAESAERNGGTAQCELCGATAAPGAPLNVDHIEPLSKAWERRLDKSNLQVLCGACNHGKLDGAAQDWRTPEPADGKPSSHPDDTLAHNSAQ